MLWTRSYSDDDRRCSFCRKPESQAGKLIASPGSPLRYICADCVSVCNAILEDRRQGKTAKSEDQGPLLPGQVIKVRYRYEAVRYFAGGR